MDKFIPLADPCVGEEEAKAVYEVVKSGWIRQGKIVEKFEREFRKYLGVKYAVAVSSGTAALHVALSALGIDGGEIILPSFTCAPPVSVAILSGTKPVFAEIESETYNINPESVKKMITKETKAIIPINYAGHPAKLDELQEIAELNGFFMVNDAAEALGAKYKGKNVSDFGDVSVFSFSPNKSMTTGEGGMIVTNNEEVAEKAMMIRDYGQKERFRYYELGFNYHMTEMQAAIGIVQLKKLDSFVKRKRKNAKMLTDLLSNIEHVTPPVEQRGCEHCYMLYSVRFDANRDAISEMLERRGIQNRVYFPPVHTSPLMKKFEHRCDDLSITEKVGSTILSLPSSPTLKEEDIYYIYESVKTCVEAVF